MWSWSSCGERMHGFNTPTVPTHLCSVVLKWAHWQLYLTWDLGFLWQCTWWLCPAQTQCSVVGFLWSYFFHFHSLLWRRRLHVSLKWWYISTKLHGVTSRIRCIQLYSCLGILLGWAPLCLPAIVTEDVIVFLRLFRHVSESAATVALDFHCPLATHKLVSCPVLHT